MVRRSDAEQQQVGAFGTNLPGEREPSSCADQTARNILSSSHEVEGRLLLLRRGVDCNFELFPVHAVTRLGLWRTFSIRPCARLTSVQRSFHIDDIVIRLCCDSWRNLTHLKLFACDHVGGFSQSLLTLSKNAPNLKSLSLQVVDEISPQCLVEFFYQPKPKITRLNLFKCTPVNDEAMAKILPLVPNLT